jgi:hypothetical protein
MSPGKWNNYIKATGSGHCVIKVYSDSLPEIPKGYFFLTLWVNWSEECIKIEYNRIYLHFMDPSQT